MKAGSCLVIGVTNNHWYKGTKLQKIKYPDYPTDALAAGAAGWVYSIAVIDGRVRDGLADELLSSLWIRADNRPDPDRGYNHALYSQDLARFQVP